MSKVFGLALIALVAGAMTAAAAAQTAEKPEAAATHQPAVSPADAEKFSAFYPIGKGLAMVGASIGAALAVVGGALGIGRIGGSMVESVARQPEASATMFAPTIITAAMVEGGMLFAIVVALLAVLYI